MGLINKYKTRLVGKIFIYQGRCRYNSTELAWCIGKIVEVSPRLRFVIYKPLMRSENLVAAPDSFKVNSPIDLESKLNEGSLRFEKYLKLFIWD